MRTETITTIRAILAADVDTTPADVEIAVNAITTSSNKKRVMGTKRDAAEILGIHPESVKRYARRGLLHPIHITARRVRYDLNECQHLADYGAVTVQEDAGTISL